MDQEMYIFGQMAVKDYSAYFQQYGKPFLKILAQYQGELLVATQAGRILEGEPFGNWTVLMKFPSKEQAYAFIKSEEYAPLIDLRVNELTHGGRAMIFPAEVMDISE